MPSAQTRYMRPHEVQDAKKEVAFLDEQLADSKAEWEDRPAAVKRRNSMTKQIADQEPPDTSDAQKDILVKREKELRDAMLVGMLSQEEMRRNPNGAVRLNVKHQQRNKRRHQMWQNIMLTLHKGTADAEIANFERFRPTVSHLGMHSAQIPRDTMRSFPSERYQENFGEIDWRKNLEMEAASDLEMQGPPPPDRAADFVDEVQKADSLADLRAAIKESRESEVVDQVATDAAETFIPEALGGAAEKPATLGLSAED